MIVAVSDSVSITFSIAGVIIVVALLVVLRLILRREPGPPGWRRYRAGIFIERDPKGENEDAER